MAVARAAVVAAKGAANITLFLVLVRLEVLELVLFCRKAGRLEVPRLLLRSLSCLEERSWSRL